MIDLLLGLIQQNKGSFLIDDQDVKKFIKNWQKKCGYVAQNIFLINDTIAANVAFGVAKNKINFEKVRDVLNKADLLEVVEKFDLKENTLIGENGLMLSGGQRQRLAIARALYRDPEIIFFDEATSALDNETAKKVLESIYRLKNNITIVFVSHDTIIDKYCDKIINLKKMNFFFLIKNKDIVSNLKIPTFNNDGEFLDNLNLYYARIKNEKMDYKKMF